MKFAMDCCKIAIKPGFHVIVATVAIVEIAVNDSSDWRWKFFLGIVYFCFAQDFVKNSSKLAA